MSVSPFSAVPKCGPATITALNAAGFKSFADVKPNSVKPDGVNAPVWESIKRAAVAPAPAPAAPAAPQPPSVAYRTEKHSWYGLSTIYRHLDTNYVGMICDLVIERGNIFFEVRTKIKGRAALLLVSAQTLAAVTIVMYERLLVQPPVEEEEDEDFLPEYVPLGQLKFDTAGIPKELLDQVLLSLREVSSLLALVS
jgi:hypothetical protein